jgi:anti-sigma B factor antagonist
VTALLPGADTPASALQVELDVEGSTCRLTLRGELCGGSLAALAAQVDQLGCMPCEQVVVDMRQVTQLDPAGAKVILGLHYYVRGRGGALRVSGAAGEVAETLRATGPELLPPEGGLAW